MKIIFDQKNPYWTTDPTWNELFLKAKIVYLNDKLKAEEIVLMYEVLKELGFNKESIPAEMVLNENDRVRGWNINTGEIIMRTERLDDGSIVLEFDGTIVMDFRCLFKGVIDNGRN